MKNVFSLIFVFAVLIASCGSPDKQKNESEAKNFTKEDSTLLKKAQSLFKTLPEIADNNSDNKVTDEKVKLGRQLYFDKQLSMNETQSCNTCHDLATYGVDNLPVSPGDLGQNGPRNSPTTFNAALHTSQFWDGREPDVEAQAGGPVLNPIEMNMPNEKVMMERLSTSEAYKEMFAKAFPNDQNPMTYKNMTHAIGAFERTLITPAHFDDYLAGSIDALNEAERKGLSTFLDAGCVACHSGNVLGGNSLQKFGLFADYWELTKSDSIDLGRFDVTQDEMDKYIFKSPSMRNVEKTFPYFHDGSVETLEEAVKIVAKLQLNKDLTEEEVNSIVTFLKTLTAELDPEMIAEPEAL